VYRILYEMIAKEHLLGNPLVPEKDFVVPKWQSGYLPTIEMVTEEDRPSVMVSRILYEMIA
jgi:hypothetical protein